MPYIFDPDALQEICKQNINLHLEEKLEAIVDALDKRYPRRISTRRRWVYSMAGGSMGMLTLLYASLSEYLIFFGSPIGSEGYSGRYLAHVYDVMLDGEMWCYTRGQLDRAVYKPGDMAFLRRGTDKGYRMKDRAWMLEYARGIIPAMLPFGVLASLIHTMDFKSMRLQFWDYGRMSVREILRGKI
jgi:hypothetical protein